MTVEHNSSRLFDQIQFLENQIESLRCELAASKKAVKRFELIFNSFKEGYFEINLKGDFTYFSPSICKMSGYSENELHGKNYVDYTSTETAKKIFKIYNNIYLTGNPAEITEYEVFRKDRGILYLEVSAYLVRDSGGNPTGFQGFCRDVTDRIKIEIALQASEEKFRLIFEYAPDAYYLMSVNGELIDGNKRAEEITGYQKHELVGKNFAQAGLLSTDQMTRAFEFLAKILQGISADPEEFTLTRMDGTSVAVEIRAYLAKIKNQTVILGIARDITERKLAEEALKESEKRFRELSIIDDLTQLYNSRHFYYQLKLEIDRVNRYKQPMTLILLDIDNFKDFNDTYGHLEGDQVLMRLGQVIKRCLRKTDSAYRYGGEEFMILLPVTMCKDGVITAERVRAEFEKENFSPVPEKNFHITLSVGVGQYKLQEEMKAFVRRVDKFMYEAKKNGKNRIFCEL